MRKQKRAFDLSAYLVIGPENTLGRPVADIVREAVINGFSFVQLRSKTAEARELIALSKEIADVLMDIEIHQPVSFVINDRLDVVLAARDQGIKIDGIHVGQTDIPPQVCRKYLGEAAVIGLSAPTSDLLEFVKTANLSDVDYLGAGPLHPTPTKAECGRQPDGSIVTRNIEELRLLASLSPLPVVVGGGVKCQDLPKLAETGVAGFFVITAITEAGEPGRAAYEMKKCWEMKRQMK